MKALAGLEPKRQKFVTALLSGALGTDAARAAGFTGTAKSMKSRAWQLTHRDKKVMAALDEARRELAAQAHYGFDEAMKEIDAGIAFSIKTENANALAKFTELRMRLSGQYIEKVDQRNLTAFSINIHGLSD